MIIPFDGTLPYPFKDEIYPDEDGVGYALRMSDFNAITFHQLASHLASPGHLYLPHSSAPALAFMFGGTTSLIAQALVRRRKVCGVTAADFAGHTFLRPKHLRQSSPQVCPICLVDDGRARAAWSIALMSCCTKHEITLVDQCSCGRRLSWRRRDLFTCECGRPLCNSAKSAETAPPGALAACRQIEYLLGKAHFRLRPSDDGLMSAFDEVTLDTFLRLIWVMGTSDGVPDGATSWLNAIPTAHQAVFVVDRAYEKLRELLAGRRSSANKGMLLSLTSIADDVATAGDYQLITSIIARLTPRSSAKRHAAKSRAAQFVLFGDVDESN